MEVMGVGGIEIINSVDLCEILRKKKENPTCLIFENNVSMMLYTVYNFTY